MRLGPIHFNSKEMFLHANGILVQSPIIPSNLDFFSNLEALACELNLLLLNLLSVPIGFLVAK